MRLCLVGASFAVLLTGCVTVFALPELKSGKLTYDGVDDLTGKNLIPQILLDSPLAEQARSCASEFNDATKTSKACDTCAVSFKVVEAVLGLGTASFTGAAAYMGSSDQTPIGDPVAQRNMLITSLILGATLTAVIGVDAFSNCAARDLAQQQLAAARQARLFNAAHDLECAARVPRVLVAKKVLEKAEQAAGDAASVANPTLTAEDRNKAVSGDKSVKDARDELRKVEATACSDFDKEPDPGRRFFDRAHEQLSNCFELQQTPFNNGAGAGGK